MFSIVAGATGRLGRVVVETLKARGDEVITSGPTNYLVFVHRYRGEPDFEEEMYANVEWVAKCIEEQTWENGDRAIVIVSSVSAMHPALNQSLAYNLSKSCQNQLARYLAKTQAVRINTVSPAGFTGPTPNVSSQEVANVIAFLCSPQSSGINGQDIKVCKE